LLPSLSNAPKIDALLESIAPAELLTNAAKKLRWLLFASALIYLKREPLFEVRRDLSLVSYNYLVAFINLKKAALTLALSCSEKMVGFFSPLRLW